MDDAHQQCSSHDGSIRGQYTLRTVLICVTGLCTLLAAPFGAWLIVYVTSWFVLGGIIVATLVVVQFPVMWLCLRRARRGRISEPEGRESTDASL